MLIVFSIVAGCNDKQFDSGDAVPVASRPAAQTLVQGKRQEQIVTFLEMLKAITTDIHFLIPLAVFLLGLGLLIKLH